MMALKKKEESTVLVVPLDREGEARLRVRRAEARVASANLTLREEAFAKNGARARSKEKSSRPSRSSPARFATTTSSRRRRR